MRSPLLLGLAVLLAVEAIGGITIFFTRMAFGTAPGETLHVLAGVALTFVYAVYQWQHAARVLPLRPRLDYALGLLAAAALVLTQATGFALAVPWWSARGAATPAVYSTWLSAVHNIGSMLVLTFAGAHLGAVLQRDRAAG